MTAIRRKKVKVPTLIGRGITMLILIGLSILVLIPLVWTVCMALKPAGEIYNGRFFPTTLVWGNFVEAVTSIDFFQYLLNTLKVVIPNVIGQVISCSLVAYGFSRYNFKGKRVWFLILLATMMIPTQVTMIPLFVIMNRLGLIDSYASVILPSIFRPFAVFMLVQQMRTVPVDYLDAARVDGANIFQVYSRVALPLCAPTLATLAGTTFMECWNDYLCPLLMLTDRAKITLPIALSTLNGQYNTEYNVLMAGSLISMIPIIIIYLFAQKHFKNGLMAGGIKG